MSYIVILSFASTHFYLFQITLILLYKNIIYEVKMSKTANFKTLNKVILTNIANTIRTCLTLSIFIVDLTV